MHGSPACSRADFCLADWLGIPFTPHGRSSTGADCYGLVYLFYGAVMGINLPRLDLLIANVNDPRAAGRVMTPVANSPVWQGVADPAFGDVLAFGTPNLFYHVGLYLKPGLMLHTRAGTDSTPERFDGPIWGPRLQGYFRHRFFSDLGN